LNLYGATERERDVLDSQREFVAKNVMNYDTSKVQRVGRR